MGPWLLVLLVFQAACLRPGVGVPRSRPPSAQVYEVEVLEPGAVMARPVPVDRVGFQQALKRLAREVRLEGPPRQAARALLAASLAPPSEADNVSAGGDFLVEVSRDRVLSLAPHRQWGPVSLTPVAEEALRAQYQQWCQQRGGGDCLGLLDDEASLLTDDRRSPWRWTPCWMRRSRPWDASWTRACW